MKYEISTEQLLRYIDGTLSSREMESVSQAVLACPSLAQKLEGLVYLYEKFGRNMVAVEEFLHFQQKKVQNNLFCLFGQARKPVRTCQNLPKSDRWLREW